MKLNNKYFKINFNPLFFIAAVFFNVFVVFNYFIKNQFFSGSATTNLTLFFSAIPYICILIIPVLCYKTSFFDYDNFIPQTRFESVFHYFISILIKYLIICITLIPSFFIVQLYGDLDFGQVAASLFCLIFYGASLISLSIFLNELFENKIAGFFTSALVIALFNSAHLAAIYISMGNLFSSFFRQISFAWHFDAASKGIIDSRDISWLSGLTVLFIYLSVLVKEKKAGRIFKKTENIKKTLTFLIMILAVLNTGRWYFRFDISKNKTFSISDYSKNLLKEIDIPLNITYYCSSDLSKLYPQVRDVSDYLTVYSSQNLSVNYLKKNPDNNQNLISLLETYGITSQQMRTIKNNSTEYINVFSAIVMEYNNKKEMIPFIMSSQTLEYDLDSRLHKLITDSQRIVNIIPGNGNNFADEYSYVVPWLTNNGFSCNIIFPEDPDFSSLLKNTSGPLFVIGDNNILIDQAVEIESYVLNNKGNALFSVSPYSADIYNDWNLMPNKNTNIIEMLENWGIRFEPKIGADISCSTITMFSQYENDNPYSLESTQTKILNYPLWISLLPQENSLSGMTLFWPVPLTITNFNDVTPYLVSSPKAYTYDVDSNSPAKLIESNPFVLQNYNIKDKEKSTLILGARINGALEGLYTNLNCSSSDIIVIPDQYFVNSLMTGYIGGEYGDYRNFEFLTKTLLELNNEKNLSELYGKSSVDESLYKIKDQEQFIKTTRFSLLLLFVIVPLSIIICGVISWILKKKKLTEYYSSLQ